MARFLLRRVLFMALTLWLISVVIFVVTEVLPGDVATAIMGQEATAEDLARIRERCGLNRPRPVRYVEWVGGAVRGDLGESCHCLETTGKDCSVSLKIAGRLGNSVTLALLTLLVGVPLSLALGVVAALRRGRLARWRALRRHVGRRVGAGVRQRHGADPALRCLAAMAADDQHPDARRAICWSSGRCWSCRRRHWWP